MNTKTDVTTCDIDELEYQLLNEIDLWLDSVSDANSEMNWSAEMILEELLNTVRLRTK